MKFYNLSPNLSNQTHQPPLYLRGLCSLFTMPFLISPHVILFLKSVTSASMVHPLIIQQANIYPFLVPKMFCEAFLYFFSQNINPLFEGHKNHDIHHITLQLFPCSWIWLQLACKVFEGKDHIFLWLPLPSIVNAQSYWMNGYT